MVGVEAATGFNASISVANGVATVSATGKAAADGWALVARVRFSPKVNAAGVYEGGVAIPQDGVFKSVSADFSAVAASQSVNGAAVSTVAAPTDLVVYPVNGDSTDDGSIGLQDFTDFLSGFNYSVDNLPSDIQYCAVFDYTGDGKINLLDFSAFLANFNVKANGVADAFYATEPTVAASSAVLASEVETEETVYALANPVETVAVSKPAPSAVAVDAALVAEALASEIDDEENAATTAVAEESVATQADDETDAERAALVETFAAVVAEEETDLVWAFGDSDDEEDAFAFDVELNVKF